MLNLIAGSYYHTNISDIEIMWCLIATAGIIFSIHNIRESFKDLAALRERGVRNGRQKIAMTGLKAEMGRGAIQTIYLLIGIFAMFFPEPPAELHEPFKVTAFRFLFQWGFIVSSIILALKSYWNYQLRRELVEHGLQLEPYETEPNGKPES